MTRFRWLLVSIGLLGATVVLLGGIVMAVGPDPSMSGTVCFTEEPDESWTQGACPPAVVPPQRSDSAVITVEVVHGDPGWIEGGFFFMRANSPDGQVVLEQRLEFRFDEAAGPAASGEQPPPPTATGEAYLPPGDYAFTVYGRSCDGNCGFLDPPSHVCDYSITVAANQQLTIEYHWNICHGRTGPGVS